MPQLVPVKIAPAAGVSGKTAELPPSGPLPRRGMIEIDLGGGRCAERGCSGKWSCSWRIWRRRPPRTNWLPSKLRRRRSARSSASDRRANLPRAPTARARRDRRARELPLLRLGQAVEARRGRHRDAGGDPAPVEGDPDAETERGLPPDAIDRCWRCVEQGPSNACCF